MHKQPSNDYRKIAFFSALCMFLSMIEYAVPKPVPFMRIGFANMSIMLALFSLNFAELCILVLIKILIQALISGTLFSYIFLFSLVSSVFSMILMFAVKSVFKNHISFIGISLVGSLASNLSQIALSFLIIFKKSTIYIAPVLLITGIISSLVLGFFTELFVQNSKWFKQILLKTDFASNEGLPDQAQSAVVPGDSDAVAESGSCAGAVENAVVTSGAISESGMSAVPVENTVVPSETQATLERKKPSARRFFKQLFINCMLFISIVFFSLLLPSGKVLFTIASFKVTKTALILGLKRALILILSVNISKLIIPNQIVFKGRLGKFLNLILIYFKNLSSFSQSEKLKKQKKGTELNLILRLDELFYKLCF